MMDTLFVAIGGLTAVASLVYPEITVIPLLLMLGAG